MGRVRRRIEREGGLKDINCRNFRVTERAAQPTGYSVGWPVGGGQFRSGGGGGGARSRSRSVKISVSAAGD